jgi:nucleoid-associated protein EbfC
MTGDLELKSLEIDPDAVDPEDVEMLQDMVMAAVNEAMRQAMDLQGKATGMGGMDPSAALDALGGLGGLGGLGPPGGGLPGGAPPNRAARRRQR